MDLKKELSSIYGEEVTVWGPYPCRDGRQRIDIKPKSASRSTTHQLARVVMEVKLGRRLTPDETVDHIDDDKTNDSPENLQVLSLADNARKSSDGSRLQRYLAENAGTEKLSAVVRSENNPAAVFFNEEVRQIREGFFEMGGFKELLKTVPLTRRALIHLLEGETYPDAGGPIVKFKPYTKRERFVVVKEG